jgi:hypothetical protein
MYRRIALLSISPTSGELTARRLLQRGYATPMLGCMTRPLVFLVAAAAVFAAAAAAGPSPQHEAFVGATRAQPVAGALFTGVTVTSRGVSKINRVSCDAKIGHTPLHARQLRYFTRGTVGPAIVGPAAVTCSWQIPTGASGKLLTVTSVRVDLADGREEASRTLSWQIR